MAAEIGDGTQAATTVAAAVTTDYPRAYICVYIYIFVHISLHSYIQTSDRCAAARMASTQHASTGRRPKRKEN